MSNTQSLLCLNQLESLLDKIHGDACFTLLERILKNCGCVRGRKAFPSLQDQAVITFLLNLSNQREDIRIYLSPYLEDILSVISEFIDQAYDDDYEFLLSFFSNLIKINCSIQEITNLLHFLGNDNNTTSSTKNSKELFKLLYIEVTKKIVTSSSSYLLKDYLPNLIKYFEELSM